MSGTRCQLTIRAEGAAGPVRQQTYDGDDAIEVRDLATRMTLRIRAADISPYRHMLYLDGRAFHILNVLKQH